MAEYGKVFAYSYASVTPSEILYTLGYRILQHPWVKVPRITLPDGRLIPINKMRINMGGIEPANPSGVTMTLAPYSFASPTNPKLSMNTENVSYRARPQSTGRGVRPMGQDSWDLVSFNVLITLNLFKLQLPQMPKPDVGGPGTVIVQYNPYEQIIMDYAVMLKHIITDHLRVLTSLDGQRQLAESVTVEWIDFPTSDWTKGANAINHTALLCLNVMYVEHTAVAVDQVGFFSTSSAQVGEVPDPNDPTKMIPIGYDPIRLFYFRMDTNPPVPLTLAQITDPATGNLYSTIETSTIAIRAVGLKDVVTEIVTMDPSN